MTNDVWPKAHTFGDFQPTNLACYDVDETEWQFFRWTLWAGVFEIGAQSLLKSTSGRQVGRQPMTQQGKMFNN